MASLVILVLTGVVYLLAVALLIREMWSVWRERHRRGKGDGAGRDGED